MVKGKYKKKSTYSHLYTFSNGEEEKIAEANSGLAWRLTTSHLNVINCGYELKITRRSKETVYT